ncbi:MAG: hypothetical protein ACKVTZ_15450 [Bacteroidia bacterium]
MRIFIGLIVTFFLSTQLFGQNKSKVKVYEQKYMMPSFLSISSVQDSTGEINSTPRYTLFPNNESNVNVDFGKYVGIFSGLGARNVGFISYENNGTKVKRRMISLNVPLALKLGDLYNWYVYGGAGFDLAINYRRKTFMPDGKQSYQKWWTSDEFRFFQPTTFVGFNYKCVDFKVEYFLNNMVNQKSKTTLFGQNNYYRNFQVQTLLFSLGIRGDFTKYWKDKLKDKLPNLPTPPTPKKEKGTNV